MIDKLCLIPKNVDLTKLSACVDISITVCYI